MTSEKRRASNRKAQAKYRASGGHDAAVRRYRQTAKGRATIQRTNSKRLLIGSECIGYCADTEKASAINAHIRKRLQEFTCHSAEIPAQNAS